METKKQVITIILGIALLSCISALTVYSGETISYNLSSDLDSYSYYNITGNTSEINIVVENMTANITIPEDYDSGTFNIIFSGYKNGVVEESTYSSGSSGGSSSHHSGSSSGSVFKKSESISNKQNESESKSNESEIKTELNQDAERKSNGITGAVIGFVKSNGLIAGIFIAVIVAMGIFIKISKTGIRRKLQGWEKDFKVKIIFG